MQPDFQRPGLQGLKRSCWMRSLKPTYRHLWQNDSPPTNILIWKLQNKPVFLCARDWMNTLLPRYFAMFLKLALQLSNTLFCMSDDSVFLWRQNQLLSIWMIMLDPLGLLHISWSFLQNLPFSLKSDSVYYPCVFCLSWYKRFIFLVLFLLMMDH